MGPMFAGKTSALLERIRVEEKTGKSVLVIIFLFLFVRSWKLKPRYDIVSLMWVVVIW